MKKTLEGKNNKGLTLIELLVVIAIIAIIASVVIVSLSGSTKQARATKAMGALSAVLPNIVSCIGNGNKWIDPPASSPSGWPYICEDQAGNDLAGYGMWPWENGGGLPADYEYKFGGLGDVTCDDTPLGDQQREWTDFVSPYCWGMTVQSVDDNKTILCGSGDNQCHIYDTIF